MEAIPHYPGDFPAWQVDSEKRLKISMLLSASVVVAMLSLVQLPAPREVLPLLELVVELTRPSPVIQPEPQVLPEPAVLPPPPVTESADEIFPEPVSPERAAESATAEDVIGPGEPEDWEARKMEAIIQVLDALEREANYSINPAFENARREASVRFRASMAPEQLHMWDSVEKDQLGRTILRLGDGSCFRVMDDPSVVNRWAFETFDQNIVYCDFAFGGKKGKELPWAEIIRERYPYLRDPVQIP